MNRIWALSVASLMMPLLAAGMVAEGEARGWTQMAGGPEHANVLDHAADSLDIILIDRLTGDGEFLIGEDAPAFLITPAGQYATTFALGLAGASACNLLLVDARFHVSLVRTWDCIGASRLVAYHAPTDTLLLCHHAPRGQPIIEGIAGLDATRLWAFEAGDIGFEPETTHHLCAGGAMREGRFAVVVGAESPEMLVPFSATPTTINDLPARTVAGGVGRMVIIDVDGSLVHDVPLPHAETATVLFADPLATPPIDLYTPASLLSRPRSITWIDTGMVVTAAHEAAGRVFVWLVGDDPPEWRHALMAVNPFLDDIIVIDDNLPDPGLPSSTRWAYGRDTDAVVAANDHLFLIDPLLGSPDSVFRIFHDDAGLNSIQFGARWQDTFFATRGPEAIAADLVSGQVIWGPQRVPGGSPSEGVALPAAKMLLLADFGVTPSLNMLDMGDGEPVGVIDLAMPLDRTSTGPSSPPSAPPRVGGIEPWVDGNAIIWHRYGGVALLGAPAAEDTPVLVIDDHYPAPGDTIDARVVPGASGRNGTATIAWGDGAISRPDENQADHSYTSAGSRVVRATVHFPDGTTATESQTVFVGGTPPSDLNWMQRAFEPKNYDLTFGLLGLAIAVAGGLFALARSRRRRNRISRELDAIERAAEASFDPGQRTAAMQERRAHVRGLLLDGRIDESQLRVLEDRIDELARGGRIESMRGRFDFLPHGFVLQVQEMLADGRLSGWEYDQLDTLLAADASLSGAQKKRVRGLLMDWAEEDAG